MSVEVFLCAVLVALVVHPSLVAVYVTMIRRVRSIVRQTVSGCRGIIVQRLTRLIIAMLLAGLIVVVGVMVGVVVRTTVVFSVVVVAVPVIRIDIFICGQQRCGACVCVGIVGAGVFSRRLSSLSCLVLRWSSVVYRAPLLLRSISLT